MSTSTTPVHIPDDEIEGENKTAGRKKEQMKRTVMAAWESWQRREPMSQFNLFTVVGKFARRKLNELDYFYGFQVESAELSEDFAQKMAVKIWRRMSKGGINHLTPQGFYSYVNTAQFHMLMDGYNALNKYKREHVKLFVEWIDGEGETQEIEHPEIVTNLTKPTGFHGWRFRPSILFKEMTENEKLVCAVFVDTPEERRMDGLVDRIICHDGVEHYDTVPVRTYSDAAEQLSKWTKQPWTERKVRNIVHRLNKKGEAKQASERVQVEAYRTAWQERELARRGWLGIEMPAGSPRLVVSEPKKTKGWYERKMREQRAEIFRTESPGPMRTLEHDGQRVIHHAETEAA